MSAREHPAALKYAAHVNPAFVKLLGAYGYGRVFERASGTRLWDSDGREYLDLLAAFGVMNLGHNPPKLRERIKAILDDDAPNLCHVGIQVHTADLAERLAHGPLTRVLFSSSGGEAIESALKLARATTKRKPLLYCTGGFHGTGFGALSVMGSKRMREPFEPLVAECFEIPFDDLPALEQALTQQRPAALIVEPIQAEAGVRVPKAGYLKRAQELCKAKGTLLILDEVQTGIGRTGWFYAHQAVGIVPDVITLAKGLGGGLPIGATIATGAAADLLTPGTHGSTFGGNPVCAAAALAVLRTVAADDLVSRAHELGKTLADRIESTGHPLVDHVRGAGLLLGIVLTAEQARAVELSARDAGFLVNAAAPDVIRLAPPLILTDAQAESFVAALPAILDGVHR